MTLRFFPAKTTLLLMLALMSVPALADPNLAAQLQRTLDDFHAANLSAPGVVVRVASGFRDLFFLPATTAEGIAPGLSGATHQRGAAVLQENQLVFIRIALASDRHLTKEHPGGVEDIEGLHDARFLIVTPAAVQNPDLSRGHPVQG